MDKIEEVLVIFKFWPKLHTRTLAENLKIDYFWSFSSFTVKLWKSCQNDQIRMQTWFTSGFLMNGTELRSFSYFQILTCIAYSDLSRNLENWLCWSCSSFNVKLPKSVKMIKFECKLDLQVVSWWMVQN